MNNLITNWANIVESLNEEKRVEKFINESRLEEELKYQSFNRNFDKMTDDEIEEYFKEREPSYADIEKLTANGKDKSDIISKEEWEALSDWDKEMLFVAANAPNDITMDDVKKMLHPDFWKNHEEFMRELERYRNGEMYDDGKYKGQVKHTWVIENEVVHEPSNERKRDIRHPDDKKGGLSLADRTEIEYSDEDPETTAAKVFYSKIVPGKYIIDNHTQKEFNNIDEAKSYVAKRMREVCNEYNIKFEDFDAIHIKKEQKLTGKKDTMVSGIPAEILNRDPNAIGFLYTRTDGEEIKGSKEKEFSKIHRTIFFEYFIYTSNEKLVQQDKMADFAKAFTEIALDNNDTLNEE